MYHNKKFLAVIQARGESKGIPKKNIVDLNGQPLIKYSIDACLGSNYIDLTCVSSDSDEILDICSKTGVKIIKRPDEIAGDDSPDYKTLQHALKFWKNEGMSFDYVIKIQPTSPLRITEDLDKSIEQIVNNEQVALISITEAPFPPDLLIYILGNSMSFVNDKYLNNVNRQSLPQYYMPNGAVYIYTSQIVKNAGGYPYIPGKTGYYHMPKHRSIDVDTLEDLKIASCILNWKK